jgi:hypothetical protein
MAITLSQDERASLEDFVRPYRPTKRQRAQALLGLAAGEPPETVAMRVGISKEAVDHLAVQFAERGLAGVGLGRKPQVVVTLIRAGVGARRYRLPEGSTLDDLIRRSGAATAGQTLSVDGMAPAGPLPLHHGAVVILAPAPDTAAEDAAPPPAVPSLRDDDLFEQYREILKARRASRAREEGSAE